MTSDNVKYDFRETTPPTQALEDGFVKTTAEASASGDLKKNTGGVKSIRIIFDFPGRPRIETYEH